MQLTEVRISLCGENGSRLKAYCSLTFDQTFVVRDVKLIDGNDGLFLAMPSRKLADHCPRCNDKNHLRARYCNNCGMRLNEFRYQEYQNGNTHAPMGTANGNGHGRTKLHADIAHPINATCRRAIEQRVIEAYRLEVERSHQPGYIPTRLDVDDTEFYDDPDLRASPMRYRPTGTAH